MRERIGNDDVGIVLGAVTVVDDDGDRARALARREVAMYVDIVAPYDPTLDLEPGAAPPHPRTRRPRRGRRSRCAPLRRPAAPFRLRRHARRGGGAAAAILDAGALRVDFGTPHGLDETRGIELLCREVLPLLRLP